MLWMASLPSRVSRKLLDAPGGVAILERSDTPAMHSAPLDLRLSRQIAEQHLAAPASDVEPASTIRAAPVMAAPLPAPTYRHHPYAQIRRRPPGLWVLLEARVFALKMLRRAAEI